MAGGGGAAVVWVNEDGSAIVFIGSVELGQGVLTAVAKIAAETLGIAYDNVTVVNGDTDCTPFDYGQSASHTTFDVGLPTLRAARDARRQLLELAAPKLGVKPEALETEDGWVYIKETPEKRLSFRNVIFARAPDTKDFSDVVPIIAHASLMKGREAPLKTCSMDFVEVEVDIETGGIKTITYVVVVDPGRAINPDGVEGQFEHAL